MNIDYIIETYCVNKDKPALQCNGKCHLAKKITPNLNTSDNETKALNIASGAFFPVFHQKTAVYSAKIAFLNKNKNCWKTTSSKPISVINGLDHPPDFYF
ncbi:hypothetical protein [Polaribacter cellanae]|uniref:Uncharacterized protein n=1 Tax=Polaribacter cellanae TaxID=2818493 RepID=A0A975CJW1_9FLAO|nr:hypothetical protein [Polaribacter cellanae]QTE21261.1 hypothetical protein J3359_10480 [Polaribacter cellanae]